MSLIDRSPGAFIIVANTIVSAVIGVEIWMWLEASALAVAVTLLLIVAVSLFILTWVVQLIEGDRDPELTSARVVAAVEQPAAATAPERRKATKSHSLIHRHA